MAEERNSGLPVLRLIRFCEDGSFWGSLEEQSLLADIEDQVTKFATSSFGNQSVRQLAEGDMCIAPCWGGVWSRAKIISLLSSHVLGTQAEVLLIDRGSIATVALSRLCPLPSGLLQFPPLAQLFTLKALTPCRPPALKDSWSVAVLQLIQRLSQQENGDTVEVLADVETDNSATLFVTVGETMKRNLNECLVLAELAKEECLPRKTEIARERVCAPSNKTDAVADQRGALLKYSSVYVESEHHVKPMQSLGESGIHPSVCRELSHLGFVRPTTPQAYVWPCVFAGSSVAVVSPPSSGKTLAYLLPLLSMITSKQYQQSCGPKLVVLVATSWQAESVLIQTQKILSFTDAALRFRCCCAHYGCETEAIHKLVNGVDVLISTPPSFVRLLQQESVVMTEVLHLVLDDVNDLNDSFSLELTECFDALHLQRSKLQVVAAGSRWTTEFDCTVSKIAECEVKIVSCPMDIAVKNSVHLEVLDCKASDRMALLQRLVQKQQVFICTSSFDEAAVLTQELKFNNWSVTCLSKRNITQVGQLVSSQLIVFYDELVNNVDTEQLCVQHVIHYSLPLRKQAFWRRFALFYGSYKRGCSCVATVLLDDDCLVQSVTLCEFLQRTEQEVPPFLVRMSEAQQQAIDVRKRKYDLCYNLKAWGTCKVANCSSRHFSSAEVLPNCPQNIRLPTSGSVKVKVSHVSNGTRLWVAVLQHFPKYKGEPLVETHNPSVLMEMTLSLSQFYSENPDTHLNEKPCEGSYFGFRDDDGCHYRVRVLKFSQPLGLYFYHKEQARVRLIDVGCVRVVDVNQLLTLPADLLAIPAQAVEACICGIKPCDDDMDWPLQVLEHSSHHLEGRVLDANIVCTVDQTIWLESIQYQVTLEGINVTTAVIGLQKQLKQMKLAEPNPSHISDLKSALCLSDTGSATSNEMPPLRVSLLDSAQVGVSAVCSPDLFYVQLLETESSLEELDEKLNCTPNVVPSKSSSTHVGKGDYCAAKFPLDERWYRGYVRQVQGNKCEVFFVDYGDTEWVDNFSLQRIDPSLLQLPLQAIECSVLKKEGQVWRPDAGDLFWTWTRNVVYSVNVIACTNSAIVDVHHVIELTQLGVSLNLIDRLSEEQSPTSSANGSTRAVLESCLSLWSSINTLEYDEMFTRLNYAMVLNPSALLTEEDYVSLCRIVATAPVKISRTLLKNLSGVIAFQNDVTFPIEMVTLLLPLLKSDDVQLVEALVVFLKLLIPLVKLKDSVVFDELVCILIQRVSLFKVTTDVLGLLVILVQAHPVCFQAVSLFELLHRLFQLIFESVLFHPLCLRLLYAILLNDPTCIQGRVHALIESMMYQLVLYLEEKTPPEICYMVIWILQILYSAHPTSSTQSCVQFPLPDSTVKGIASLNEEKFSLQPQPESQMYQKCRLTPLVRWSQQKDTVTLAVQIRGCSSETTLAVFENDSLQFQSTVHTIKYAFTISFYKEIIPKFCTKYVTGSEVLLTVHKAEHTLWPQVSMKKLFFISTDIDRWMFGNLSDHECRDLEVHRMCRLSGDDTESSDCTSSDDCTAFELNDA